MYMRNSLEIGFKLIMWHRLTNMLFIYLLIFIFILLLSYLYFCIWLVSLYTISKSLTRPPLIKTTECSCILCPIPGIYAVTSKPDVNRTRATFLSAELGFFGVVVYTLVQTPLLCGQLFKAGDFVFFTIFILSER